MSERSTVSVGKHSRNDLNQDTPLLIVVVVYNTRRTFCILESNHTVWDMKLNQKNWTWNAQLGKYSLERKRTEPLKGTSISIVPYWFKHARQNRGGKPGNMGWGPELKGDSQEQLTMYCYCIIQFWF